MSGEEKDLNSEIREWSARNKRHDEAVRRLVPLIDHEEREASALYTLLRRSESHEEEDAIYALIGHMAARKAQTYRRIASFWEKTLITAQGEKD